MDTNQKKVNITLTATVESTGKQVHFKVVNSKHLIMLDEDDQRSEIMEILIEADGSIKTNTLNATRWPSDAGKCLLECSRGCNGDCICVAECAALCSTIIIG